MSLSIPDFDEDTDTLSAALAYAKAGWYMLPVDPHTKDPGSLVGKKWPMKSSRDPEQLVAWFAGTSHALCLHVGRSGALAFDVDEPTKLPPLLRAEIARTGPPFQSTRDDTPGRGHYLFAMPAGRNINNSNGGLGNAWGQVRGKNGVVVVQPSPHTKDHGRYLWLTGGVLPELSDAVALQLNDAGDENDAASDAEVVSFFAIHQESLDQGLVRGVRNKFLHMVEDGQSRHVSAISIMCWAMREAAAGLYPALMAATVLKAEFRRAINGERPIEHEWNGIVAWAVGQAPQAVPEETRAAVNQRVNGTGETSTSAPRRIVKLTPASAYRIQRVHWGWVDRMPVGEMTLVPGREGAGKSLLLAWMAAQITSGTLPGEFYGTPRAVLYAASEDSWNHTIAPRLKAAGADLDMVYHIEVEDLDNLGGRLSLPVDCLRVADAALDVKAAALLLDPIISLIHESISVNQSAELRRALEPLRRAAEAAELMVVALAHFNKTKDIDVLSKIPGARAWAEVARAAFGVAYDEEEGHFVGSQIKNNLGRLDLPHLSYRIENVTLDAVDGPAGVGRLVWTGESETGVSDLLDLRPQRLAGREPKEPRGRPVSERTAEVVEWIAARGYPVRLSDVYAAFPESKPNTLRMAVTRAVERGDLAQPIPHHFAGS